MERWLAGRWIAGPKLGDAIERARAINRRKISVLINYLGEDFTRKADVDEAVQTYLTLITTMSENRINGDISIKPTQIGLCISYALARENYLKIMEKAKMNGIFVWLDMEEPRHVPQTITMYLEANRHVRGGICVQANLRRSADDAKTITRKGGMIRLVKGAYGSKGEPGIIESRVEVAKSYREIMGYLFEHSERFMVATHDMELVRDAIALNNRHRRNVEYAMLNGIDNQDALALARKGEKMSLYLPFGIRWTSYSYRRLREAGHLRLIVGSLFRSQQI